MRTRAGDEDSGAPSLGTLDARVLDPLARLAPAPSPSRSPSPSPSAAAANELATPVDVPLQLLLLLLPAGDARRLLVRGPARSLSFASRWSSPSASAEAVESAGLAAGTDDDDDERDRGEWDRGRESERVRDERSRRCFDGRVDVSLAGALAGGDDAEEEGGDEGEADESDGGKTGIVGCGGGGAAPRPSLDFARREMAVWIAGRG